MPAAGRAVVLGEWDGAVAEVSLSGVDAGVDLDLGTWSVAGFVLAIVDLVFYVDLGVRVTLVRLTIAGVTMQTLASSDMDVWESQTG